MKEVATDYTDFTFGELEDSVHRLKDQNSVERHESVKICVIRG